MSLNRLYGIRGSVPFTGRAPTTVLVTGANDGPAPQVARFLLRKGNMKVILGSHDAYESAPETKEMLESITNRGRKPGTEGLVDIAFVKLDLGDAASRFSLQHDIQTEIGTARLDYMVHAGNFFNYINNSENKRRAIIDNSVAAARMTDETLPFLGENAHIVQLLNISYLSKNKNVISEINNSKDIYQLEDLLLKYSEEVSDMKELFSIGQTASLKATSLLSSKFEGRLRINAISHTFNPPAMNDRSGDSNAEYGALLGLGALFAKPISISSGNLVHDFEKMEKISLV